MRPPASPPQAYTPPPPYVDADQSGFSSLRDYLANGDKLIQEQQRTQQFLSDFRKTQEQLEKHHQQLEEQYAQMEAKTRQALNRIAQAPAGERGPPVASRSTPSADDQTPLPAATQPFQTPNLSGFKFPAHAQNQAEAPAVSNPIALPAAAKLDEALPSLANNLENERIVNRDSTIATEELEKLAESKEKDDAKLEAAWKVAGGKGPKPGKSGKQSLREALKAALARKERESGSQSATRELLDLAQKGEEGRAPASDPDAVTGNGPLASAAAGADGGSGFSTSGFGQADLDSGAVSLGGDGAQAQMSRLRNELDEKAAPEVLGRETPDLFQRVRGAHQRSQKNGRLALRS